MINKTNKSTFLQQTLFLLLFFFMSTMFVVGQDLPTANLLQTDTAFCDTGDAKLRLEFTGASPFAFKYKRGGTTYTENGGGNIIDETYFELTIGDVSSSELIELVAVYDSNYPVGGTSGNVSGNLNIRVDEMPVVSAGEDKIVCGYEFKMEGVVTGTTTSIIWSDPGTLGSFDDINLPTAVFSGNTEDSYLLTLNVENGTCEDTDDVNVTLQGSPKAEITDGSWKFCSTSGTENKLPVEVNFTGNGDFTYSLKSDIQTTNPVTTSSSNINIEIPVNDSQIFVLESVVDGNGCAAEVSDLTGAKEAFNVKPNPYAGDDVVECSQEYTLQATLSEGATGAWSSAASGISFTSLNDKNSIVSSLSYQLATLIWTEEVWTDELGSCYDSDEVVINFAESPKLSISGNKSDQICEDLSTAINLVATGNLPWNVEYNKGGGTLVETIHNSNYTKSFAGSELNIGTNVISFTKITGSYGCVTTYSDNVYSVLVDKMPTANAGPDDEICGKDITLAASFNLETSVGEWSGSGEFVDSSDPETFFTANSFDVNPGQAQVLTWTETNGKCEDTDEVLINFHKKPNPVFAGNDTTIYAIDNIALNALQPDEGNNYEWSFIENDANIENVTSPSTVLSGLEEGVYKLLWTVSLQEGSCPAETDEIVITVKNLFSPTGFSPNGDELNETFQILGIDNITNNQVTIFNKEGKVIFKSKDYQNDWRGTGMDGQDVPSGTYFYVLEGDQLSKPIKNYLIIKR